MIEWMSRWALYLAFGSVATIVVSIAVSQLLLGTAVLVLLYSRVPLRFPPIKLPLILFMIWTVVSAIHSGHFISGLPQIRKFFVFLTALVVCSCFRNVRDCLMLIAAWSGFAAISASIGFAQLHMRYKQARAEGASYYEYFLDSRMHGLAGHWMTFGGELMVVSILLVAFLLWSRERKLRILGLACITLLWTALALGLTRGVFLLGLPVGAGYLLFTWHRWSLAVIPLVIFVSAFVLPFQVSERVLSVVRPHGLDDSNSRRVILWRTGLNMIRSHLILGVGPEQVGAQFLRYVPDDIPRPLPKGWYGHLHNIYIQFAAERGIPALLLLLWILIRTTLELHKDARQRNRGPTNLERCVLHGAVAVTLGVMVEGLFEHNLGDSEVLTMFLAAISCGYVVKWSARNSHQCDLLSFRLPLSSIGSRV
jgi:O-antigen ligase